MLRDEVQHLRCWALRAQPLPTWASEMPAFPAPNASQDGRKTRNVRFSFQLSASYSQTQLLALSRKQVNDSVTKAALEKLEDALPLSGIPLPAALLCAARPLPSRDQLRPVPQWVAAGGDCTLSRRGCLKCHSDALPFLLHHPSQRCPSLWACLLLFLLLLLLPSSSSSASSSFSSLSSSSLSSYSPASPFSPPTYLNSSSCDPGSILPPPGKAHTPHPDKRGLA